jgi:hypothetical protein
VKSVSTYSLFGKLEGAGTEVSLTNSEFRNLGVRFATDCVVTVDNLPENESFNFASACFTAEDEVINGIGESCTPILTLFPLQIPVLWATLAAAAFELSQYKFAHMAAKKVISFYAEKTSLPSQFFNSTETPILNLRLDQAAVAGSALRDLELVSKTFVIFVKCVHQFDKEKLDNKLIFEPLWEPTNHFEAQVETMKCVNIVSLAVELAVVCANPVLIRQIVHDLNENLMDLLRLNAAGPWVLNALVRAVTVIQGIADQFWDNDLRRLAC